MIPLFFVCLFSILGFGLYFRDYIFYNSMTRSIAREAALKTESSDFTNIQGQYFKAYGGDTSHMYIIENQADIQITSTDITNGNSDNTESVPTVRVDLTTTINSADEYGFIRGLYNTKIFKEDNGKEKNYFTHQYFHYSMFWENKGKA